MDTNLPVGGLARAAEPKAPSGGCLPSHGRVDCSLCHRAPVTFDVTRTEADGWRITANPLAWGSSHPEVLVLGFSM